MNSISTTDELVSWIRRRNREVAVSVEQVSFRELKGWRFNDDTGNLEHESGRFFSVCGLDVMTNVGVVSHWTQPIINQPEVGYLGILCKKFNGVEHYLLQAKIEPGNVNCVQLSPTLQATRSNYMQVHGGRRPAYLDYFLNVDSSHIVVDQLQSEQGARFLRKRNRNMIVRVDGDIEVGEDFRRETLAQIKEFIRKDNLVNMDTRTVLSGLREPETEEDHPLLSVDEILHRISELKTRYELVTEKVPLKNVRDWHVTDDEIVRNDRRFFRVIGARDIDFVYCALPTGLHYEWVAKALAAHKHVLCEKSLVCHLNEAIALVDAARNANVLLMESFQFRFHAQNLFVKDLLAKNTIGELRQLSVRFGVPPFPEGAANIRYSAELGGGALLDNGAYTIKCATYLLGSDVKVIAAVEGGAKPELGNVLSAGRIAQ